MVRIEESVAHRTAALLACDEALKNLSEADKRRVVQLLALSLTSKAATTRNYVRLPPRR